MIRPLRIVQRNAMVYRRVWRGSVFSSFLQPAFFLLAMGLGLGGLIDSETAALPGNVPFLQFLAPGLLAAACMQTAAFESSWPVHVGDQVGRGSTTRCSRRRSASRDVVLGHQAFIAIRVVLMTAVVYLVGHRRRSAAARVSRSACWPIPVTAPRRARPSPRRSPRGRARTESDGVVRRDLPLRDPARCSSSRARSSRSSSLPRLLEVARVAHAALARRRRSAATSRSATSIRATASRHVAYLLAS